MSKLTVPNYAELERRRATEEPWTLTTLDLAALVGEALDLKAVQISSSCMCRVKGGYWMVWQYDPPGGLGKVNRKIELTDDEYGELITRKLAQVHPDQTVKDWPEFADEIKKLGPVQFMQLTRAGWDLLDKELCTTGPTSHTGETMAKKTTTKKPTDKPLSPTPGKTPPTEAGKATTAGRKDKPVPLTSGAPFPDKVNKSIAALGASIERLKIKVTEKREERDDLMAEFTALENPDSKIGHDLAYKKTIADKEVRSLSKRLREDRDKLEELTRDPYQDRITAIDTEDTGL